MRAVFYKSLRRVRWLFLALVFLGVQFLPLTAFVQTAQADAGLIAVSAHQGQLKDGDTGALLDYTAGSSNITTYTELDSINFRFNVTADDASSGQMQVEFTSNDTGCLFFDGSFHLGTHDGSVDPPGINIGGGAMPTIALNGVATNDGSDWIQKIDFSFSAAGEAQIYYYLTLSNNAGECSSGSPQHSRLTNSSNPGDFKNIGNMNIPIPARELIELPEIIVYKQVVENPNDDPRLATAGEWEFSLDGGQSVATDSEGKVVFQNVTPDGPHTITESGGPAAYISAGGSGVNCTFGAAPGTAIATVTAGTTATDATCYFVNRKEIQPTITLIKSVNNPYGTPASEDSFGLSINGTSVLSGEVFNATIGQKYAIDEVGLSGYEFTSINGTGCPTTLGGLTDVLIEGQNVTCTITNTAIQPKLTITKVFKDDKQWGDTATPDDFNLTVNGAPVLSGVKNGYNEGTYSIGETVLSGYEFVSITGDTKCPAVLGGSVTLALGDDISCTITNQAIRPMLTLKKIAINDNGGTVLSGDFTLRYDGTGLTGNNSNADPNNNTITTTSYTRSLAVDTYILGEDAETGYTATAWSCVDSAGGPVALAGNNGNELSLTLGDHIYCEITNNDDAPGLTLVKNLVDTYNSNADVTDWTLTATGALDPSTDLSGTSGSSGAISGSDFKADTYTLGESSTIWDGTGAFTSSSWSCENNTTHQVMTVSSTLAIALGEFYTCTIANTAVQPKLTVIKHVEGAGSADGFRINVTGNNVSTPSFNGSESGTPLTLNVGDYSVSEEYDPAEYTQSLSADCNGTINLGDDKTCTITNTRNTGKIELQKDFVVSTDSVTINIGTTVDGSDVDTANLSDDGTTGKNTVNTGTYYVSEQLTTAGNYTSGLACYNDFNHDGVIDSSDTPHTSNPANGEVYVGTDEDVVCVFTNTRKTAPLYVNKFNDVNGNGVADQGDDPLSGWTMNVYNNDSCDGTPVDSAITGSDGIAKVNGLLVGGTYWVDETLQSGWILTTSACRSITIEDTQVNNRVGFGNFQYGTITGQKFNDENGNGVKDVGEVGLYSWTINLDKDADGIVDTSTQTDVNGEYSFSNLTAGVYRIREVNQTSWTQTSSSPSDITIQSGSNVQDVDFGNVQLSDIHGYKWNDLNGNGIRDCADENDLLPLGALGTVLIQPTTRCEQWAEPLLAGWTIELYKSNGDGGFETEVFKSMVTSSDSEHEGWYWFEDLLPGEYKICEVNQFGWLPTYPVDPSCHIVGLPYLNSFSLVFSENAVVAPEYNFGNQKIVPLLTLAKTNDASIAKRVGDIVTYTLTLTNPNDFALNEPEVVDTPPKGFEYIAGSWTANSDSDYRTNKDLKTAGIAELHPYASPGVWTFGGSNPGDDVIYPGETITLTYQALIDSLVSPGVYPDLAFATAIYGCEQTVFANIHLEDSLGDPFVGTKVTVITDLPTSTYTLVETGASNVISMLVGSLMVLGAIILYAYPKVRKETN